MPRASDTKQYRQHLLDNPTVSETFVTETLPHSPATADPPGSAALDILAENSPTPAILRQSTLYGFVGLSDRVHTVTPGLPIARELLREEPTKCRAYGQQHGHDLNQLDQVMIPVVLEQTGRMAPGAHAVSRGSFSIVPSSLSDKGWPLTLRPKGRPAIIRGGCWFASCSEQRGDPWRNVCQHTPRPGRHIAHHRPGWILCLLRPGLLRTFALLTCCPPKGGSMSGRL